MSESSFTCKVFQSTTIFEQFNSLFLYSVVFQIQVYSNFIIYCSYSLSTWLLILALVCQPFVKASSNNTCTHSCRFVPPISFIFYFSISLAQPPARPLARCSPICTNSSYFTFFFHLKFLWSCLYAMLVSYVFFSRLRYAEIETKIIL